MISLGILYKEESRLKMCCKFKSESGRSGCRFRNVFFEKCWFETRSFNTGFVMGEISQ